MVTVQRWLNIVESEGWCFRCNTTWFSRWIDGWRLATVVEWNGWYQYDGAYRLHVFQWWKRWVYSLDYPTSSGVLLISTVGNKHKHTRFRHQKLWNFITISFTLWDSKFVISKYLVYTNELFIYFILILNIIMGTNNMISRFIFEARK